ncbi:hypothetical protein H6G91_37455 [Nostoc muscorum FACHB-395]|nr:hypothetical protein [Desmonostoc muscorum FACHB-395]
MFQPSHTLQVNPIEGLWKEVKRHLDGENFGTSDELRQFIWKRLEKLNTSIVASITGWDFILDANKASIFRELVSGGVGKMYQGQLPT